MEQLKSFFRIIRQNGGIWGCIKTVYYMEEVKDGTLVGVDQFCNRYYENNRYFFGRNRWVEYADYVKLEYDASMVPPEWFGWLHNKTDLPPHLDPARPHHCWMLEHTENFTGTTCQYVPYSTTRPKIEPWKPKTLCREF